MSSQKRSKIRARSPFTGPATCLSRRKCERMLERELCVTNQLGLHARAAAQLVRLASGYKSRITLTRPDNGVTANAKSILSVLHLAAAFGIRMTISVDGADEQDAIEKITRLFAD